MRVDVFDLQPPQGGYMHIFQDFEGIWRKTEDPKVNEPTKQLVPRTGWRMLLLFFTNPKEYAHHLNQSSHLSMVDKQY